MTRTTIGRALAVTVGALSLAVATVVAATPSFATIHATAPWVALDTAGAPGFMRTSSAHSRVVDENTVRLKWKAGELTSAGGTSVETSNLGLDVAAGDLLQVEYQLLDGASAAAGSVRFFIYMVPDANTVTDAPAQFVAAPVGPDHGTLAITVATAGTIGTAGLVYDTSNGGVEGTVRFRNLQHGQELIAFTPAPTTAPTTTQADATQPATATPAPTTTASATTSAVTSGPATTPASGTSTTVVATATTTTRPVAAAASNLPLTGTKLTGLIMISIGLLLIGVVIVSVARRRRSEDGAAL